MTSVPIQEDRRLHRRYPLQTPLQYRAANGPLNSTWKSASAVNMSAGGILVQFAESIAPGVKLELAMDWTGLYHNREKMRLFLIAQVTRTGGGGTALRIVSHRFRDLSPTRVRPRRAEANRAVA